MASAASLVLPLYRVTKIHTAGLLTGLTTTEETTVKFNVGFVCAKAIGGGSYEVTACEEIGTQTIGG